MLQLLFMNQMKDEAENMQDFEIFTIEEKDGTVKEYSVLSKFKIKGKKSDYMIYTDYSTNNKKMNIQISKYTFKDGKVSIIPITNEDEKKQLMNICRNFRKIYNYNFEWDN